MTRRIEARVKGELLYWARETSGLTAQDAARKAQVKAARLEEWEQGEARPTINQLRKLARIYKRPLAVFYLSEPPKTFQPMRDFRRLPGAAAQEPSPELALEIRRAFQRREIVLDLVRELEEEPPQLTVTAKSTEDGETIAVRLRKALGVSVSQQTKWRDPYQALNAWRDSVERLGILVFQARGVTSPRHEDSQ